MLLRILISDGHLNKNVQELIHAEHGIVIKTDRPLRRTGKETCKRPLLDTE